MESAKEVSVLVEAAGLPDALEIRIPLGSKLRDIVVQVAAKAGFPHEDAVIFVEDGETPLELDLVIDEKYDHKRVHHVHRAKKIEVIVFYQNGEKKKEFPPSARVKRVLAWAVGPEGFKIDPPVIPEMSLQLVGTTEPLRLDVHIGRLVHHRERVLKLNLVRGTIVNGAGK